MKPYLYFKYSFRIQHLFLPSFQQLLLKRMLVFSHKMVFIENEAALLCVTMRECARTCAMCSLNLVYNFLIQLLQLKSLAFVVHFLNAFWHENKTFRKGSSQYEIVPLLVVFHLPYSKDNGVKICFTRVVIKMKIFHSCCTSVVPVALVSHSCRSGRTRVVRVAPVFAFVSLVSHLCRSCLALVL